MIQAKPNMSASTTIQLHNASSLYFGKILSRGDFVKSTSGAKVIPLIDNWVARGMEMLIADPDWKNCYDNAGTLDFLFLGIGRKNAICGTLTPSADASSRRFPFIGATLFEIDDSLAFFPLSALVLEQHTEHQRALTKHAARAPDAAETLSNLGNLPLSLDYSRNELRERYQHFLRNTTVKMLAESLSPEASYISVRQMVLAIGYLLHPVLGNAVMPPQKGLAVPLPRDVVLATYVKTLWMDLVSIFLKKSEFELSVFACAHHGEKLIITFNGATPAVFHTLFHHQTAQEHLIDVSHSAWVEDYALQDAATIKLSSYLSHPDLRLSQLVETFQQCFSQ